MDGKNILITGASGFIGSFLCEESLRRGNSTWAAMRKTSSKRWLKYDGLQFVVLDLTNKDNLKTQLSELGVKFDVVIHAAGATKCLKKEDFDFHNFQCTRNLVEVMQELQMMPHQFIYMSSLSAIYGSTYGESKLKTENWLKSAKSKDEGLETKEALDSRLSAFDDDHHLLIFRPTGVYGPREKDYFLMAKSIKQHVDFAVGYKPQLLTFVYVKDLVGAIFTAIDKDIKEGTFNVTDGEVYSSRTFSDLIQTELGVKGVLHITAPLWFLKIISIISEDFSKMMGKPSTLNRDKYKIMAQRDWTCDIEPMKKILGYTPQWQLPRGVKETMEWYKKENWI